MFALVDRHFPFDDASVGAGPSGGEEFVEDLGGGTMVSLVEGVRETISAARAKQQLLAGGGHDSSPDRICRLAARYSAQWITDHRSPVSALLRKPHRFDQPSR